jgi:hypothetical protein
MALHTDPRPGTSATGHGRTIGHRARRLWWTLALLLALAVAATLGVVVAAQLTHPPASTPTVQQTENSNRREDRVSGPAPAAPTPPPNAREDRATADH